MDLRVGATFRNMLGMALTISSVDDGRVTFVYDDSGHKSSLPRSTVEHAIRTARWS